MRALAKILPRRGRGTSEAGGGVVASNAAPHGWAAYPSTAFGGPPPPPGEDRS